MLSDSARDYGRLKTSTKLKEMILDLADIQILTERLSAGVEYDVDEIEEMLQLLNDRTDSAIDKMSLLKKNVVGFLKKRRV